MSSGPIQLQSKSILTQQQLHRKLEPLLENHFRQGEAKMSCRGQSCLSQATCLAVLVKNNPQQRMLLDEVSGPHTSLRCLTERLDFNVCNSSTVHKHRRAKANHLQHRHLSVTSLLQLPIRAAVMTGLLFLWEAGDRR